MTRRPLAPGLGAWPLLLVSLGASAHYARGAQEVPAVAPPLRQAAHWASIGDEIVRLVRANFYDRRAAEAWVRCNARYAATADSASKFAAMTNRALADLKVSHTAYYTGREPGYYDLLAIYGARMHAGEGEHVSCGVDVTQDKFVRIVFAGGPAAKAGLRRGDKIVNADGKVFDPVESFRNHSGAPITLSVQRKAGQPPIPIRVRPRRIKPGREWLDALEKGAKVITRNGKTVAYAPMFACAGEQYENALRELLSTRLRKADALILDFRDGWGGCNPDFVNLFHAAPAVLAYTGRGGSVQRFDSQWRKPLYVLINGGSRSGKEVVAFSIKKHRLGTLIGQPTAGAVVAGRCFLLSDRSLLLLAVDNVSVDGERLEGRGVEPDIRVADDLPFADGADPQLETAIGLAAARKR